MAIELLLGTSGVLVVVTVVVLGVVEVVVVAIGVGSAGGTVGSEENQSAHDQNYAQ